MYFHSYLQRIPADGYQHVSALVSCKHIHLHESGSFTQFWLQLKVFQDNEAANDRLPWGLCPEKDCLQDPLVTFDHEKRISYIHLLLMPLMPWGIILTGQQESQAHLPGPVRLKHPVHTILSVQHSCQATAAEKLCKKYKGMRLYVIFSNEAWTSAWTFWHYYNISHGHLDFSGFAIHCRVNKIYGNFW